MINITNGRSEYFLIASVFLAMLCVSCESFLDVELSETEIVNDQVFSSDITATSAVAGIYNDMLNIPSFSSGSNQSIVALAGLSSDELRSYSANSDFQAFYRNSILPENFWNQSLWSSLYKIVYEANSVIEGIEKSTAVSENTRRQLLGEALFIRAFCHFYLVNLFGDIPLVLSTDYNDNLKVSRQNLGIVYSQIISDLQDAQASLGDSYVTDGRVRPNRSSATALLARVYLYRSDWQKAEEESSKILNDARFRLEELDLVFKAGSMEAIWQLMPVSPTVNTQEGFFSILIASPVNASSRANALTMQLVESFEVGDARLINWINSYKKGEDTWYYPYKYKIRVRTGEAPVEEYSMVFRLAEQYLIRSEARANQDRLSEAMADLDSIRSRAKLELLSDVNPNMAKKELLLAIEHERRVELFSEWGHRWLDLKRWNKAGSILSSIKPDWSDTDALYPIPKVERSRNPDLGEQNPGY